MMTGTASTWERSQMKRVWVQMVWASAPRLTCEDADEADEADDSDPLHMRAYAHAHTRTWSINGNDLGPASSAYRIDLVDIR